MRISDWSSDVCSSDLDPDRRDEVGAERFAACERLTPEVEPLGKFVGETWDAGLDGVEDVPGFPEIRIGSACHLRYHGWHRHRSGRSEEHTSELQSLMRTSYGVFCLNKKNDSAAG